MTSAGFVFRMAWREARAARRRLALLTASVMAGVGAWWRSIRSPTT